MTSSPCSLTVAPRAPNLVLSVPSTGSTISFHLGGKEVGRLYRDGEKLRFKGDNVDDSAQILFDYVVAKDDTRLELVRAKAQENELLRAKVAEVTGDANWQRRRVEACHRARTQDIFDKNVELAKLRDRCAEAETKVEDLNCKLLDAEQAAKTAIMKAGELSRDLGLQDVRIERLDAALRPFADYGRTHGACTLLGRNGSSIDAWHWQRALQTAG